GRRGQSVFFETREDESIDGCADPVALLHIRQRRPRWSSIGPVHWFLWRRRLGRRCAGGTLWPLRALVDPRANQRELRSRQRIAVLRHSIVAVEAEDPSDDQALIALARDKDDAAFSALRDAR